MELSLPLTLAFFVLFFCVAFLYSTVGHGGASGYLAILSFLTITPQAMSSTALILNVFVASIAFYSFVKENYFSLKLTLPFIFLSVPLAFIGGILQVEELTYKMLLAFALAAASISLFSTIDAAEKKRSVRIPSYIITIAAGGFIGLLSGIVGIGGGVFLTPLLIIMGWATAKQAAATSALFIVVNSIAALLGRAAQQTLTVGELLPFLIAAVVGGYLGSNLSAKKFSDPLLRRILAIVLMIAAARLWFTSFG